MIFEKYCLLVLPALPHGFVVLPRGEVGMGNLYADEALHYARIHPLRPANTLSKAQVAALREGIVRALEQGLRNLGTSIGHEDGEQISLRDHVNLSGEPGANQEYVVAYGREGRECLTCHRAEIIRTKIGNRSAHFCPECQPRGSGRAKARPLRGRKRQPKSGRRTTRKRTTVGKRS